MEKHPRGASNIDALVVRDTLVRVDSVVEDDHPTLLFVAHTARRARL